MWSFEHQETTTASREAVWNLWKDVSGWPTWDEGIASVTIDRQFAEGAKGKLKPSGGPAFPFEVTEVEEGRRFTDVTRLPLATLTFVHELREHNGSVVIHQGSSRMCPARCGPSRPRPRPARGRVNFIAMWILEHREPTSASRKQIWALWSDLPGWPQWDETLEAVTVDGPFESGTSARVKPEKAKEIALELREVDETRSFVDLQFLPKATMRTEHEILDAEGGGLVIRQTVSFSGPLARLFRFIVGRGLKRDMPAAMRKLVSLAETA
jgi:ligand-binding SRPBCC domain-containing protein